MRYYQLSDHGVQSRANDIRPFLQRIVDEHPDGSYTVEGIIAKFYKNEWSCWVVTEELPNDCLLAVAATATFPDMKGRPIIKIIFIVGENFDIWKYLYKSWEEMAAQAGIYMIETVCRKGFVKMLSDYEYQYVVLTKVLTCFKIEPNTDQVGRA